MRKRIDTSESLRIRNNNQDGKKILVYSQFPYGKDVLINKGRENDFLKSKINSKSNFMNYNDGLDINEEKYFFSLMGEAFK